MVYYGYGTLKRVEASCTKESLGQWDHLTDAAGNVMVASSFVLCMLSLRGTLFLKQGKKVSFIEAF